MNKFRYNIIRETLIVFRNQDIPWDSTYWEKYDLTLASCLSYNDAIEYIENIIDEMSGGHGDDFR